MQSRAVIQKSHFIWNYSIVKDGPTLNRRGPSPAIATHDQANSLQTRSFRNHESNHRVLDPELS